MEIDPRIIEALYGLRNAILLVTALYSTFLYLRYLAHWLAPRLLKFPPDMIVIERADDGADSKS